MNILMSTDPSEDVSPLPRGVLDNMEDRRKLLMAHPEARNLFLARLEGPASSSTSTDTSPELITNMGDNALNFTFTSARASELISSADWNEDTLVNSGTNFHSVPRISAQLPADELLAKIKDHETSGIPLIIGGWDKHPGWDTELFTKKGFADDGDQIVDARNVRTAEDVKMPLRELLEHYETISKTAEPGEKQRFYGKDLQCPPLWNEWLKSDVLPSDIHPFGTDDMFSHLPEHQRPETLMCYLGIGDTYTPAHKDLCGSFGQNLMCHTSDGGSAFWFMTATGPLHTDKPAMYFQDILHSELDLESHTASIGDLRDAPFDVYVAEQRLGDLVLVPPRSCHQVVNRGGLTIKMSWSRMGLKSFQLSLYDELPLYHRVCRIEIYRVKLNIFHAVKAYGQLLSDLDTQVIAPISTRLPLSSCRDTSFFAQNVDTAPQPSLIEKTSSILKSLLLLLDEILVQEWNPGHMNMPHVSELHSCDFCGADIFQSFFRCTSCIDENSAEFICCAACYVEGRSCKCEGGIMESCQTRPFDDLIRDRNTASGALNLPGRSVCNSRSLNDSPRLHLFEAACKLQLHKRERMKNFQGRTDRRCTTRIETDPAHDVPAPQALNCGHCHSNVCFRHILGLYGVHAADALLAHAQDRDQTVWHTLHKNGKRKMLLGGQASTCGSMDLVKRMTWAASKFRRCRPVDSRAKEGYYDDFKLVGLIEEEVGEACEARKVDSFGLPMPTLPTITQTPEPTPLVNTAVANPAGSLIAVLRSDSPLTELSEDEMDVDDNSFSESSRSASQSPVPVGKDRTTSTKATVLPGKRSRQIFECVLLPAINKRPAAPDSVISPTPTKKPRTIVSTPLTPMVDRSPSIPGTSNTATNGTPTLQRVRQPTLVPVAIASSPVRPTVNAPSVPKRGVATIASSTQTTPEVNRRRLPEGTLIGRPTKRKVPRRIPVSPESSPDPPITATAFGAKKIPPPSTANKKAPTDDSSKVLRSQLADKISEIRNLELDLKNSRTEHTAFKLKQGAASRQLNQELSKLKDKIRDSEHQVEQATSLERKVAELTKDIQSRDERIESLQRQLEEARNALSQRESSMNGMCTAVGIMGQSIGAGLLGQNMGSAIQGATNAAQGPNTYVQPVAGPSYHVQQAGPHMQVARRGNFAHRGHQGGPMRSRGSQMGYSNRGRASYQKQFPGYVPNHTQYHHQRGDGFSPRGRSVFSGRPSQVFDYDRGTPSEGTSFKDDFSEAREYRGSDDPQPDRTVYNRGDGGWSNVKRGAHTLDHVIRRRNLSPLDSPSTTRDYMHSDAHRARSPAHYRSPSRSQSPDRPATPPRSYYSRSPSRQPLDPGEERGSSPDIQRFSPAPQDLDEDTTSIEQQERVADPKGVPHNAGSQHAPPVNREVESEDLGPESWENADNPWRSS